jgi:hypothetical protein
MNCRNIGDIGLDLFPDLNYLEPENFRAENWGLIFFTDFSAHREQAEDLSKRFKIGGHIIRLLFTSNYYKPNKSRVGPEIYLKTSAIVYEVQAIL